MVYITQEQYNEYIKLLKRNENTRLSKKKYQKSEKGREKAREAMRRYRARKRSVSPP